MSFIAVVHCNIKLTLENIEMLSKIKRNVTA